jgi:nitrate/nitrite-specific signal transduction histidine kinase
MQSRNSTELQKIKSTFENMIEKTKNADPAYSAKIYRYLGEIDEFIGEEPSAIKNYEAASSYDDKIGVTRKLQALKRKNQSPLQGA